jgi:hypothetical protein
MKYIISSNGCNIGVGLLDSTTSEEDINLSHNLFNTHANYSYYHGVLAFSSVQVFYRFLINKYYLRYWDKNKTFREILKAATNTARGVINKEVSYHNFLSEAYLYNSVESRYLYKWSYEGRMN